MTTPFDIKVLFLVQFLFEKRMQYLYLQKPAIKNMQPFFMTTYPKRQNSFHSKLYSWNRSKAATNTF